MSIIPASRLSPCDLALLGKGLGPSRRKPRRRRELAAVNRSLAILGERVGKLYRPRLTLA
jgi:hypothetical protein